LYVLSDPSTAKYVADLAVFVGSEDDSIVILYMFEVVIPPSTIHVYVPELETCSLGIPKPVKTLPPSEMPAPSTEVISYLIIIFSPDLPPDHVIAYESPASRSKDPPAGVINSNGSSLMMHTSENQS
jgi:hypothetical protein